MIVLTFNATQKLRRLPTWLKFLDKITLQFKKLPLFEKTGDVRPPNLNKKLFISISVIFPPTTSQDFNLDLFFYSHTTKLQRLCSRQTMKDSFIHASDPKNCSKWNTINIYTTKNEYRSSLTKSLQAFVKYCPNKYSVWLPTVMRIAKWITFNTPSDCLWIVIFCPRLLTRFSWYTKGS